MVSVNGNRADGVTPEKFLALQRTWKDGDRVEIEFEMTTHLEAIDEQFPNRVALMYGPLALFAVGEIPSRLTRNQLLAATKVASSGHDWQVRTDSGMLTFRPYANIMSESYRLYQIVEG
jgi:DUF1680 family protein